MLELLIIDLNTIAIVFVVKEDQRSLDSSIEEELQIAIADFKASSDCVRVETHIVRPAFLIFHDVCQPPDN
jgi:hypothetical protein